MKKVFYVALIVALFLGLSCERGPRTNVLRIGYTDYSFDQAVVMVLKGILDQQENLEVELYRLPDSTMFRALVDDELDIAISMWLPHTHQMYLDMYRSEIQTHSIISDSIGIYLVVPSYMPVNSISDLRNFGSLLRNTIMVPESQNAIYHLATDIISDYDLRGFTLQETAWDDIVPFIAESLSDNAGFAFVSLRPHWIFERYELKVLEDVRQSLGEHENAYLAVNSKFVERMPLYADFFSKVRFSLSEMETLLEMNQTLGTEPYENAMRWINQNTIKINLWLLP